MNTSMHERKHAFFSRVHVAALLHRCDACVAVQRKSFCISPSEHLFVSPSAPSLVHHVLLSPARAPNTQFHRPRSQLRTHTETIYPSLHTSLQSSTLPSSEAYSGNPAAHHICLPTWMCVTCHLPSHQPSTTRTRSKVRTKTASCCEAGRSGVCRKSVVTFRQVRVKSL